MRSIWYYLISPAVLLSVLLVGSACGSGNSAPTELNSLSVYDTLGAGPSPPLGPGLHQMHLSFVQQGETTRVAFAALPAGCSLQMTCVALVGSFPPIGASPTAQVSGSIRPSPSNPLGNDFMNFQFHGSVTARGLYLPLACGPPAQDCVRLSVSIGLAQGIPVLGLASVPGTFRMNITALGRNHFRATFSARLVRERPVFGLDTVTVTDGYVDAWNTFATP